MKKVLVTGAGGFIGSHLAEKCVEEGYKVRALIRYNSSGNWGWLENSKYKNKIEVVLGDVRDLESVNEAIFGCDTVFHLAALIGVPYSYHSAISYLRTNIEGTYNVLEVAKSLKINNVLITSTSETYGTAQYVSIDEKHPQVAQSPYAATKIGADQLASSFFRSFGLPVKIVRPFNVYGPRQSARSIIPTIILQILLGTQVNLGNISAKRDFTYVDDTVSGFLAIAKTDKLFGEVVNIGSGQAISVEELVVKIAKIVGKKVKITKESVRARRSSSEVDRLLCDFSKLKKFTGWKPTYSLEEGLAETINWFVANKNMYKGDIYNI